MDSSRPILPTELEFFNKGTGKGKSSTGKISCTYQSTVPLVAIFTKFDGQITGESGKVTDMENDEARWDKARENAETTFQRGYLPKIFGTQYPPKAYVRLEGEDHEYSLL
jgi:hypothetical protein